MMRPSEGCPQRQMDITVLERMDITVLERNGACRP